MAVYESAGRRRRRTRDLVAWTAGGAGWALVFASLPVAWSTDAPHSVPFTLFMTGLIFFVGSVITAQSGQRVVEQRGKRI